MMRTWVCLLLSLILVGCASSPSPPVRPRLGVVVVFDQLRAADLDRYSPLFGPSGFGGLLAREAAWFDAYYGYAETKTGPGHATLLTGANPSIHGITSNYWYEDGERIYVVAHDGATVTGVPEKERGPAHLEVGTLGDAMKVESLGRAKVVTVSVKDRAAILTGGHAADVAIWFESKAKGYTTSSYYGGGLPGWAKTLARDLVDRSVRTGTWSPLPLGEHQGMFSTADVHEHEEAYAGLDTAFPHDLAGLPSHQVYDAYKAVPQSVEDLFSLALAAVEGESLGDDEVADLLVVSISALDYVGHLFGPNSVEAVDMIRRADLALRAFLRGLDDRLGSDGYVLAVSSDHGSTPLVERVVAAGVPADRILRGDVIQAAEEGLASVLGPVEEGSGARVSAFEPPHLYLDVEKDKAHLEAAAMKAARAAIQALPGIAMTYNTLHPDPVEDGFAVEMRESAYPGRSGAILVRQKPRHVYRKGDARLGTEHGTPYTYDQRIPLFFVGNGVRGGRYAYQADPRDLAPTLSFLLGVSPPDAAQGEPVPAVGEPY